MQQLGGTNTTVTDDEQASKRAKRVLDQKETASVKSTKPKTEEQKKVDRIKKTTKEIGLTTFELGRAIKKLDGDELEEARVRRMRALVLELQELASKMGGDGAEALDEAQERIAQAKKLVKAAK